MTIKIILTDLYEFLRRPNDEQIKLNFKNKFQFILILLGFEIAISLAVIFPLMYLINEITPIKQDRFDYADTFFNSILYWVLIVPVIEEIMFRYFMRFTKTKSILFTRKEWDKIFPFLVYIPVICFGLVHISNFTNDSTLFYILSPLLVISQLTGGLIISFIRVRLNFLSGVIYHWSWNFLFVIALPVVLSVFMQSYTEKTSEYQISIDEKHFFDKEKDQVFKIDSTQNRLNVIHLEQYSMQHLLDSLYSKNKYYVDDVLINLDFKSNKGLNKEAFLEVLKKEYEIKDHFE
ncbi:CPBP family intramembrane metalloprotease [Chryseobacterium sp. SNU WT5]|uniref:CPBP family intramembrane glutamic endopeptidase n=1 Tax=Chryseobacterium sp. SNU WT5 TaxID=2594269 RepID=UPI00117ECAAB|nr:CPBP family intramembrane glutamic endopeptidase [Chryseobacterium sp. SNU WT5]QDP85916.1 CPBP family intramembrane metalloprotease [Chryseobacterium sp. SNU WT5]